MVRIPGMMGTAVGRRLFAAFLLAAFLPVTALALLAYFQARAEIGSQVRERAKTDAKLAGLATLAALARLRGALANLRADSLWEGGQIFGGSDVSRLYLQLPGSPPPIRELTARELSRLHSGQALLSTPSLDSSGVGQQAEVWLGVPSVLTAGAVVWGKLDLEAFFDATRKTLEAGQATLCVLSGPDLVPLSCHLTLREGVLAPLRDALREGERLEMVQWSSGDSVFYSSSWSAFLQHEYGSDDWQLIVSRSSAVVLAPIQRFGAAFFWVTLLALVVVFFLSHLQIRRSTEPLARLHAAASRIAAGDLDSAVSLPGRDEFADLGRSFERMRQSLGRQFLVMRSLDSLHRSAMGAREFGAVAGPALRRLSEVVPGAKAAIGVGGGGGGGGDEQNYFVFSTDSSGATRCRSRPFDTPRPIMEEGLIVEEIDGGWRALFADSLPPDFAWTFFTLGGEAHANGLVALASLRPLDGEERESVRRLCDRLGAALAQVRLVRQLDAMNDGMLKTLAMIVDASSHWTAGHSERVTEYAVLIGERMGLTELQLETLRRGALLHDLGKVGIPAGILDKIGVLSERERRLVERHTVIGAEILSPLAAFADLIPIVRSHHERWDGSGYPDGLRGEEIPLLARIVAVADVFDALVSERPYRPGLSVETSVAMMRSEAGVKLDRRVLEAFLHVLSEGAVEVVAGSWRESTMLGGHLRLPELEVLP